MTGALKNKVFTRAAPLLFACEWFKKLRRPTSNFDQALVLIGACTDDSAINGSNMLASNIFRPHVALKSLLECSS
jgi:hypothetical protein